MFALSNVRSPQPSPNPGAVSRGQGAYLYLFHIYESTVSDSLLIASTNMFMSLQLEPPNLLAMHRNAMPVFVSSSDKWKLNALVLLKEGS